MGSMRWPQWAKQNSVKRLANSNSTGKSPRRTARPQVEKLEDRLALASVITPHYEIPNFGDYATIQSDSSGAWSNPDTWSAGRVPTANDVVVISTGTSVTYDLATSAALDSVVIYAGGLLNFRTDISTQMLVTNLQVLEGGELRVGTAANPVAADVTAQITIRNVALDTVRDPSQFGNGLIGLGKITMHGANRVSYVRLAVEPRAGQTTLTLEAPATGWRVGDKLFLPDSKQWAIDSGEIYTPRYENATISAISADGKTITLAAPLQFNHLGVRNSSGALELLPHVANRTRNIVVRSESSSGTRGYVLFTGRADVDVRYASFAGTGRTKLGATGAGNRDDRHPVTFAHLYGPTGGQSNGHAFTFVGNAVLCGLPSHEVKWGIAIRDSHYGLIQNNLLYNWTGAGLITIDGNESFNVIEGNASFLGRGVGNKVGFLENGQQNPGDEGVGFWFKGANNRVLNNVAANWSNPQGEAAYGFKYMPNFATVFSHIPNFLGADTTVAGQYTVQDGRKIAIIEFDGNEAYGVENGLGIWEVNSSDVVPNPDAEWSTIKNFRTWHYARYGFYGYPMRRVIFDGFVALGDSNLLPHAGGLGMWFGDYLAHDIIVRNSRIEGRGLGFNPSTFGGGGEFLIENTYLNNVLNIMIDPLAAPGSGGAGINREPRKVVIRNVTYGTRSFPTSNIEMRWSDRGTPTNYVALDEVYVHNYAGTGQNYRLYYNQQAANWVWPQSLTGYRGAGQLGLTNQQNWDQFGVAIAGAVAPGNTTTVAGIVGMAAAFTVTPDSTAPSTPTGLTATPASPSRINLAWTASSDNTSVAGYRIYRNGVHIGTSSGTSYASTGLAPETTYTYTVVAYDAAGNTSAASAPASATTLALPAGDTTAPSTPTGLTATAVSTSRINLAWTASTDNVQVTGYRIFRNGVQIGTSSTTSYAATGLNAGTTYSFTVRAFDAAGNLSAASAADSATTHSSPSPDTTAPSAPTGLSATAASTSRIDLAWTASTDNVQVAGYRIFRNGVYLGTSSTTSYAATGLNASTTYSFFVRAYDAAGNVSGNSAAASATTLAPPPPTGGNSIVDNGATGSNVTAGWTRTAGSGYQADMQTATKGAGGKQATWSFTGLADGQYNFWVTYKASSKNATNAPFSINTGNGSVPVVKVNQRLAPTQIAAGTKWRFLMKVNVLNGWAQVRLTNNANGNVVADAVRLVKLPAAAPLPASAAMPASVPLSTSVVAAKPPLSARTFLALASAAHSQGPSASAGQQTVPPSESPAPGAAHDQVFGGDSDVGSENGLLEETVNLLSDLHGSAGKDGSSSLAIDELLASSAN